MAAALAAPAKAEDVAALYTASWAGMPAGGIWFRAHDDPGGYRYEIRIQTAGLPHAVTHFRGYAVSEGELRPDGTPAPRHYAATYDLRKRRDRHLDMQFVVRNGATVAERGPADTSDKPPLAARFRENVVDPMTVVTIVRSRLRRGTEASFTIPVYDGARRFDAVGRVLPKKAGDDRLRVDLVLRPIAGFKGESSSDGNPGTSPRRVELSFTDDRRLLPLSMSVPVYYLPLDVRFERLCTAATPCP